MEPTLLKLSQKLVTKNWFKIIGILQSCELTSYYFQSKCWVNSSWKQHDKLVIQSNLTDNSNDKIIKLKSFSQLRRKINNHTIKGITTVEVELDKKIEIIAQ